MSPAELTMDLGEVVKNLVLLGLDETYVRSQFASLSDEASWLDEVAALMLESEAALVVPRDAALPAALFALIDGLRQVGAKASCGRTEDGELAFCLHGAQPKTFVVKSDEAATVLGLVRAVVAVWPRAQQVLMPVAGLDQDSVALRLIVLERGTFVALRAAVGDGGLERRFERVSGFAEGVRLEQVDAPLAPIDSAQRWQARLVELDGSRRDRNGVFERLCTYDPRVAWPVDRKRPPGDDFFEFCAGLANGSLARAFTEHDDRALADLLYRFALATSVGAHYDVAAARQNPGMSAQGVLGFGQLTWAWFIFEALGAGEDAAISGRLLDSEWVRAQERSDVSLRQRAYYDLGAYLRTGARGPALGRVFPLLPLAERAGWQDAAVVEAALATHSEISGDQLTQHPLYYLWPATLYALARRAHALELLPRGNPFLNRALELRSVDFNHPEVLRLKEQLLRFGLLDEESMSPLLDPLPVIIDVEITAVDEQVAHGRTMLAAREDAEHRISAPRGGRDMHPGEVWLFEVQGAKAGKAQASYDDLGEVSYNVSVPTGQWLERA